MRGDKMTVQEINLMRRSIQYFDKTKPLDYELVKRVINEAVYAPSSYNLQPWRVILVKTLEQKETLYNLAYKQEKIKDAPMTLIIVADKEAYKRHNKVWDFIAEEIGEDAVKEKVDNLSKGYDNNEIKQIKNAHISTSLFSMNLMLLFKGYGIDSHPIGGMKIDEVKKAFNILEHEDINMAITIGYHDDQYSMITRKRRKNYDDIVTEF